MGKWANYTLTSIVFLVRKEPVETNGEQRLLLEQSWSEVQHQGLAEAMCPTLVAAFLYLDILYNVSPA